MAETILATASERQVWVTTYFQEYVRQSRFMPYMTNADLNKGGIILTKFQEESEAKRTINIPFIGRLQAADERDVDRPLGLALLLELGQDDAAFVQVGIGHVGHE